jgi:phosphoribosylaminoimidazole-succinocarboxamide synthase
MRLLRTGKVKEVYELDSERLLFRFTDSISVFDKIIPSKIPYKGECLCRSAAYWFKNCSQIGVNTHYIEISSPVEMIVRRVDILPYEKITPASKNYLIPLEVITRYYIAGSLWDRIRNGKIPPEKIGIRTTPHYGMPLPEPYFELTTKLEPVDRKLSIEEAMRIACLSREEIEEIRETTLKIDEMIASKVAPRGLIHVDGKKEYAFDHQRRLMIVDTFGTADEDRWWIKKEYDTGNFVEFSKEFVRQYYRKIGYLDRLEHARTNGQPEPDIPPLPEDLILTTSNLYRKSFEMITGEHLPS